MHSRWYPNLFEADLLKRILVVGDSKLSPSYLLASCHGLRAKEILNLHAGTLSVETRAHTACGWPASGGEGGYKQSGYSRLIHQPGGAGP
jgi:hypothetical protein